jgi:hypothetical protein
MARVLLIAASAALLASTSAAAAVHVVRSSGPSAAAYPPGKALPDNHMLKLKATDTVVLLDSRGTRTLNGPGNFSVLANASPAAASGSSAGTSARRVRLGAVRGAQGTRSVWQADLTRTGNVCIANPSELTLYRADSAGAADVTLTDSDGKTAKVHFDANQWESPWPSDIQVKTGKRINVSGLAQPTTLTLRQLTPIPSGLEGMAQSLIRADCQAQLDVLVETFTARSEG